MKVILSGIVLFFELVVIAVFIGLVAIVATEILEFISDKVEDFIYEHFH